LIERYSPPAIRAVWSDQHRFELWLRIEILACEAWAALGRIPASALPKIRKGTFDAGKIADEVIQHLTSLLGAEVEVTLEIQANVPDGVPDNVVRIVTENANTLKFTSQGFEEE
jgi:adenylosuccinate lyase